MYVIYYGAEMTCLRIAEIYKNTKISLGLICGRRSYKAMRRASFRSSCSWIIRGKSTLFQSQTKANIPFPERMDNFYTLLQGQRSKWHILLGGTPPYSQSKYAIHITFKLSVCTPCVPIFDTVHAFHKIMDHDYWKRPDQTSKNGQVWGPWLERKRFFDGLKFWKRFVWMRKMIFMEKVVVLERKTLPSSNIFHITIL